MKINESSLTQYQYCDRFNFNFDESNIIYNKYQYSEFL